MSDVGTIQGGFPRLNQPATSPRRLKSWRMASYEEKKIRCCWVLRAVERPIRWQRSLKRYKSPRLSLRITRRWAGQLCSEFKEFFPDSAVEYFVSYYDYYQPEAYIPLQRCIY